MEQEKTSKNRNKVLSVIIAHAPVNQEYIQKTTKLGKPQVRYAIRKLTEKGLILTRPNLLDMRSVTYLVN